MNWLDFVIIGIIVWFAFAGFSAGILREFVTLLGTIGGLIIAGLLYERLAEDVLIITDSERVAKIAAFIAIFGAIFLAGQIAANLLKHVASLLMLGAFDSAAGLIFGLIKGFVLVEGALILFARYPVDFIDGAMAASRLTPFFLENLPVLLTLLPGEFRNAVESFRR